MIFIYRNRIVQLAIHKEGIQTFKTRKAVVPGCLNTVTCSVCTKTRGHITSLQRNGAIINIPLNLPFQKETELHKFFIHFFSSMRISKEITQPGDIHVQKEDSDSLEHQTTHTFLKRYSLKIAQYYITMFSHNPT